MLLDKLCSIAYLHGEHDGIVSSTVQSSFQQHFLLKLHNIKQLIEMESSLIRGLIRGTGQFDLLFV